MEEWASGFALYVLDETIDEVEQMIIITKKHAIDLIIWDSYDLTEEKLMAVHFHVKVAVIDDLAALPFYDCDIVINQNLYAKNLPYKANSSCHLLLGAEYFLLRKEFLEIAVPKGAITDKVSSLLITMGGADPFNATGKLLNIVEAITYELLITVIVGGQNLHKNSLENQARKSRHHVILLQNVSKMQAIMVEHDFSIHGGGLTAYELAYLGVPGATVMVADNQKLSCVEFEKKEIFPFLGEVSKLSIKETSCRLDSILKNAILKEASVQNGKKLVDGFGVNRIVEEIISIVSK